MRAPDLVIGPPDQPYLKRWHIIPHNPWFNIFLHQILRDDDDRALHDHPWANVSIVLKGTLREVLDGWWRLLPAGTIVKRSAETAHRLEVLTGSVWTLFLTGPKVREWGFHCPKGWVHWREYVKESNRGEIGRGCGP